MPSEQLVIWILIALNIVQMAFWPWQIHRLIDKLMSRNYAEYVSSKSHKAQLPLRAQLPDESTAEEESILAEVNHMLGGT